jgi:hypothetical protein
MGLLYVFPVGEDEADFVVKKEGELTLKTYGLPYIFWFYALCCIAVVFFMFLAIKEPVLKLVQLGDETDSTLGYSLLTFVGLMPVFIFSFFFYEKRIVKKGPEIRLVHKVFGITVFSEKFILDENDSFSVDSFLSSPNVARMKSDEGTTGFQNKGYFVLWLKSKDGKRIQVDRHSRKADLDKLRSLLETH